MGLETEIRVEIHSEYAGCSHTGTPRILDGAMDVEVSYDVVVTKEVEGVKSGG